MEKSEKIDLLNKAKIFLAKMNFDQEEFAVQVFEDKGVQIDLRPIPQKKIGMASTMKKVLRFLRMP